MPIFGQNQRMNALAEQLRKRHRCPDYLIICRTNIDYRSQGQPKHGFLTLADPLLSFEVVNSIKFSINAFFLHRFLSISLSHQQLQNLTNKASLERSYWLLSLLHLKNKSIRCSSAQDSHQRSWHQQKCSIKIKITTQDLHWAQDDQSSYVLYPLNQTAEFSLDKRQTSSVTKEAIAEIESFQQYFYKANKAYNRKDC